MDVMHTETISVEHPKITVQYIWDSKMQKVIRLFHIYSVKNIVDIVRTDKCLTCQKSLIHTTICVALTVKYNGTAY